MADCPPVRSALTCSVSLGICLLVFLDLLPAVAQGPKIQLKPTELIIKRYERLILQGALLSPGGWKRASELFTAAEPYPQNGDIRIMWTGTNTIGEEWNNGSRAQVNTKWNDFYGTVDSNLEFKADGLGTLPLAEEFQLSFVLLDHGASSKAGTSLGSAQGQWRIDGPLRVRSASISDAIKYLERIRNATRDPMVRKKAQKTIAALKHLSHGCGTSSAC